jgi:hypothetical protein
MIDPDETTHGSGTDRFGRLGTLALGAGLSLVLARALEASHGFPAMPRFWYQNDSLWWLLGFVGIGTGSWLLGRAEQNGNAPSAWQPTLEGRRFHQLVLYTREDCKLCDEAQELLAAYLRWLPPITSVDIDDDPRLIERFGKCVPVVELDGKVRFKGRINEILLRRLIEGTVPDGNPKPEIRNPKQI